MKTLFNQNRLAFTFAFYTILILAPLSVLVYQGVTSLDNHKNEIEKNVINRLEQVAEDFDGKLRDEWVDFIHREKFRKFYDYQPVVVADLGDKYYDGVQQPDIYQRSDLYQFVDNLNNLYHNDEEVTPDFSPTVKLLVKNSMIGYFQYEPRFDRMTTPYDPVSKLATTEKHNAVIHSYREFLNGGFKRSLADRLNVAPGQDLDPHGVLVYLKIKRRILKTPVPTDIITRLRGLYFKDLDPSAESPLTQLNASYYDFSFFSAKLGKDEYVCAFRPVVLATGPQQPDNILIQGILFNVHSMIQEGQSYLETLQPEFGNVVIGEFSPTNAKKLHPPFDMLSVSYKTGEEKVYLKAYREEQRRFWVIMGFLMISLIVSLVHLKKLISANIQLQRKKNDFISAVTHELKAPLTSIIMYTEMLEEGWAKGKESTYHRYIHCESERLSRLIKNILDYSGIERGGFKLKKGALLLNSFIEDTLEPLEVWIQNNGLKLELDVRSTPYVNIDKDSLSQVIYNLCDNSIKYATVVDEPTLKITIDEDKTSAVMYIYDNGPGVPKSEHNKIFNRFYRCENELTRESTGTGLGLALVRELVEANGGTVVIHHPGGPGFGVKIVIPKIVLDASLVSQH